MSMLATLAAACRAFRIERAPAPDSAVQVIGLNLPEIVVEEFKNHMKCFTSPNPDLKATIFNTDGKRVGTAAYAISPLFDRVYIFDLRIDEAFRRKGFGLAFIRYVVTTYQLPITTIKELFSSSSFWAAARIMVAPIVSFTETLSISEMDDERQRWEHLKPDMDRLDELITQRFLQGESYESAVGRGLEA